MKLPHPRELLPEFMQFIDSLAQASKAGTISDWDSGVAAIMEFFTPENLDKVEKVIPHWKQMTSYGHGITCAHVTLVVLSTLQLPEYQVASPEQQTLMLWVSLFHDVEKVLRPKEKDHVHGFRSAVTAAGALPVLGFETKASYLTDFEAWADYTFNAICSVEEALTASPEPQAFSYLSQELNVRETQDNRKLPEILAGIDALFQEPAAFIIKAILLHMSLNVVDDYPYTAALSDAEIRSYVSAELYPFLKVMNLVDCDGWAYFDLPLRASWRAQILAKFTAMRSNYRE
jgi:hypothetical protein